MYTLIYWPFLPGRGEFARFILEDAGVEYIDRARLPESDGGGKAAVLHFYKGEAEGMPVAAPPILLHGDLVLAQTGAICHYLGSTLRLLPNSEAGAWNALQVTMTVTDIVSEVHDTHHPVASYMTYEDQKDAAIPRTRMFLETRLPKFLGYLERVQNAHGGPWLLGERLTYVDLTVTHLLRGLEYAFPNNYRRVIADTPRLAAIREAALARPNLAAYVASDRCMAFNEHGIFRRYPELDLDVS